MNIKIKSLLVSLLTIATLQSYANETSSDTKVVIGLSVGKGPEYFSDTHEGLEKIKHYLANGIFDLRQCLIGMTQMQGSIVTKYGSLGEVTIKLNVNRAPESVYGPQPKMEYQLFVESDLSDENKSHYYYLDPNNKEMSMWDQCKANISDAVSRIDEELKTYAYGERLANEIGKNQTVK